MGRVGRKTPVLPVSRIPAVASGGIFDGRGIAAALMLSAVGVNLGTRFIASKAAEAEAALSRAEEFR
jgi:NAD(P)H-dependent flavin oxidoreductase YrpB (nitropropane dioxygenase family)